MVTCPRPEQFPVLTTLVEEYLATVEMVDSFEIIDVWRGKLLFTVPNRYSNVFCTGLLSA